ncbi:MAG: hypothetical protein P8X50_15260 [Maritimibacter sp.]
MIRLLALLVTLLLPAFARAQGVVATGEEQADFTRVFLQMRVEDGWSFGKVAGGFEFRAASTDTSYDLSTVFDTIPRNRIAQLRDRGDGRLFFAVGCDCHGDAFVFRDGQMVLDIIDGAAPTADWPFEAQLGPMSQQADPAAETQTAQAEAPDGQAEHPFAELSDEGQSMGENHNGAEVTENLSPDATADRAGLPLMMMSSAAEAGLRYGPLRDYVPSDGATSAGNDVISRREHVQETQTALLEQIARAAAQGLLDADMGQIEAGVARATKSTEAEEDEPLYATVPNDDGSHISVETSIDMAAALRRPRAGATDDGTACLDPDLFDIGQWGAPIEEGIDLGAHRSAVVGEFDAPDTEGMTDLTKYYIYLTFGAEARSLIKNYPDVISHPAILYVMADVMDNEQAAAAASIEKQMACDGATALWATLAQPRLNPGQTINTKAVTLTFSSLPKHLRRHLGPQLAKKFLDMGDQTTADIIHRAFGRVVEPTDSAADLVEAEFEIADGEIDTALGRLDTVVANADSNLPEALLKRVNTTLDHDKAVPLDTLTLLESLLFEQRGTETGKRLIDANIRARGSVRDFHRAFELLREAIAEKEVTPERAVELRQILFGQLATNSADASFLRRITGHMDQVVQMPAENRRPIAERFLALSLPGPAKQVLDGTGTSIPAEPDRLLYARAALLDERPDVAIGYLSGLEGDVAEELRARALAQAKDYRSATSTYEVIGNQQAALDNAWRGGLWPDVSKLDGDGAKGAAAQLMQGGGEAPLPDTPIARSETLIENSQTIRDTIGNLLSDIEPLSAR